MDIEEINNSNKERFAKAKKVKPTHVGQKCPVCGSYGTVGFQKKTCHGCQGKGYILIPCVEVG